MRKTRHAQNSKKKTSRVLFTLVAVAAAIGLVIGVIMSGPLYNDSPGSWGRSGFALGASSALAQEVISSIDCACGCKLRLKDCHCDIPNGSVEMKSFINELAGKNLGREEILREVKKKYRI